jgi:hypothetical protein
MVFAFNNEEKAAHTLQSGKDVDYLDNFDFNCGYSIQWSDKLLKKGPICFFLGLLFHSF